MIFTSLHERLMNWGEYVRDRPRTGHESSPTGRFCDALMKSRSGYDTRAPAVEVDEIDGNVIEKAVPKIPYADRELLTRVYVLRNSRGHICRVLGLRQRPGSVFDLAVWRAQRNLEVALDVPELKGKNPPQITDPLKSEPKPQGQRYRVTKATQDA